MPGASRGGRDLRVSRGLRGLRDGVRDDVRGPRDLRGVRSTVSFGAVAAVLAIACTATSGTGVPPPDASGSAGHPGTVGGTGGSGLPAGSGGSGVGGAVATGGSGTGAAGPGGSATGGAAPVDAGSSDATGSLGAVPTAGCGMPATDTPAMFVRHTLDVAGTNREYFVRLPAMYDVARAYPVVFLWHGAGGTGTSNNVPIERSSGANAILVGGTALVSATEMRTQWIFNNATSPDVAFFDALVADVSARYCVDRSRLFSAGFSSGAWLSNLLGCVRGNVMRAYGVAAGGLPGGGRLTCTPGGVAAWFIHDENDTENLIAGNVMARDRLLTANGCGMTTVPDMPPPCMRYEGCRDGFPVVWCQTVGAGHSVQATISAPGMWRFFSSF